MIILTATPDKGPCNFCHARGSLFEIKSDSPARWLVLRVCKNCMRGLHDCLKAIDWEKGQ